MKLDKARYFYNGRFHTMLPPPCKQCFQVRVHKQNTETRLPSLVNSLSSPPLPRPTAVPFPEILRTFEYLKFLLSQETEFDVYSNGQLSSSK